MEKFQNKYRIPSARLENWDYGNNAAYFITICTKDKIHYFGDIKNNQMKLNELGILAEKYWFEIPNHFPFVKLGNFVIMPNHVHGILIIDKPLSPSVETLQCNVSNESQTSAFVETLHCNVSTTSNQTLEETLRCNVSTEEPNEKGNDDTKKIKEQMSKIAPKSGSISTIIRSYKSVVSKNARYIHADFCWQSRFHDHIIRNSTSYENIRNYIINNAFTWEKDKFYSFNK